MAPFFTPDTFKFLQALAKHNDKEWFAAHKADYETHVKAPSLAFIAALAEPLKQISPQLVANPKPVGGSLFRIYRDTRFSGDKSPYKTHIGLNFYHAATKATARAAGSNAMMGRLDAPGLYLHIEPGACFIGGGLWHPQPETLKRVRAYMVNNPASWKAATRSPVFVKTFGALGGESLQRPPAGFDPAHELIDDLKRKDYVCGTTLDDAIVTGDGLLKTALADYRQAAPMLDWLCGALDLDF